MSKKVEYMTVDGLTQLQNRMREVELKLTKLQSQRKSIVGSEGDGLYDNFAFEQLEIEERGLFRAVAELKRKIADAKIIASPESSEYIDRGSVVTLKFEGDETETFAILGSVDSAPERGIISDKSPLGSALLGKRLGDYTNYEVYGRKIYVQVVSISR